MDKLKIGEITCAFCVQTIEKALKKTEGVIEANVNIETEFAKSQSTISS